MNLKSLKDSELLSQTKQLVQNERQLLTKILHHLREVERRRLFSDLGYQSLFEYTVKELKYSEGQAGRRIQALRLIKEIPEIEKKIATGKLSLSNISQAQSYFREVQKREAHLELKASAVEELKGSDVGELNASDTGELKSAEVAKTQTQTQTQINKKLAVEDKLKILESLENKSAREGQKILIQMQPQVSLPKEKERTLTESHSEMRFVMSEDLKKQLEELRSLLGVRGANMSFTEIVNYMVGVSIQDLKIKKFGKKRVQMGVDKNSGFSKKQILADAIKSPKSDKSLILERKESLAGQDKSLITPTLAAQSVKNDRKAPQSERYISRAIQHQVWTRDSGKCTKCGTQRNLNMDHIKPMALGGRSHPENLRLLCFYCNQREAIKIFGVDKVRRQQIKGPDRSAHKVQRQQPKEQGQLTTCRKNGVKPTDALTMLFDGK